MIGLWRSETLRLIGRRRWLAALPAFALAAILNLSDLQTAQAYQLKLNIWDGVFGTLTNWLYFRFIILLLFVFLTADSVIQDIDNNWAWLVLPRANNRVRWWTAKVASIFSAALIYFLLGLIIVFIVSAFELPYAPGFSQYATGQSLLTSGLGPLRFPAEANPLILACQLLLYSSFAVTVFMLIPITISMVIRKAYIAPLIPFAWIFLSNFWQTNNFLFSIDLIPRLFYGSYFASLSSHAIHLSTSLIYLSLVGIGCYCIGIYIVRKADF